MLKVAFKMQKKGLVIFLKNMVGISIQSIYNYGLHFSIVGCDVFTIKLNEHLIVRVSRIFFNITVCF